MIAEKYFRNFGGQPKQGDSGDFEYNVIYRLSAECRIFVEKKLIFPIDS